MKTTTKVIASESILASKRAAARALLTAPQHIRFFDFVDKYPGALTWQIARECGIGYSPARAFEINEKISIVGLRLICRPPARQRTNQFGEPSRSNAWFLVETNGDDAGVTR